VVGAWVGDGVAVVELWLEELVDDVVPELVVVVLSAVLEELDGDLPAYEAAAA